MTQYEITLLEQENGRLCDENQWQRKKKEARRSYVARGVYYSSKTVDNWPVKNPSRRPIQPHNGFAVRANYLATTDVLALEFKILFI
jgi:hypothetical protein